MLACHNSLAFDEPTKANPSHPMTEATSFTTPPAASSTTTILVVVIIILLLLLLAVGGVLFVVCVLRAKSSRKKGRERTDDHVYDTVVEREMTDRFPRREGVERRGDGEYEVVDRKEMFQEEEGESGDREYATIEERRETIETEKNQAYGHFNVNGGDKEEGRNIQLVRNEAYATVRPNVLK